MLSVSDHSVNAVFQHSFSVNKMAFHVRSNFCHDWVLSDDAVAYLLEVRFLVLRLVPLWLPRV
jgi:hypothetical protein